MRGCMALAPRIAVPRLKPRRVSPLNHTYGQFRTSPAAATTDVKGTGKPACDRCFASGCQYGSRSAFTPAEVKAYAHA